MKSLYLLFTICMIVVACGCASNEEYDKSYNPNRQTVDQYMGDNQDEELAETGGVDMFEQ
ncbi:MAG: hypothetical protein P9M13_01335 [Candidatus Ancaeobacter aquaticus]|nr:hypothetical protein [Candidatus Ancaeobacter aquaticus]